ncbi:glycosyltransferase family 2 protein [Nocardiopsis sp. NPDC057823]|uniref:glycosyltransferase family 2 protein n=1 Tax=Nocardiopsis sp. NPDC057823 TaxID=3346256 RepID=UPI00367076B7
MTALSVIIPAKDVAPYIGDTLASLVRNDRPDFEYIVIDDGSADDTPNIVDDFRRRLPNLRMLRNPAPTGLSSVRNQGTAAADGRYLVYLDGDDWFAPGYLPRALDAIRSLDVDFIRTDHVQVYGDRRVLHEAPEARILRALEPRGGIMPSNARTMVDYPNAWSGVFDRRRLTDDLLRFDPALLTCEDRPWTWRLHIHAASYARVPEIGVFYRRAVGNSLTQVTDERQLHFLNAFRGTVEELSLSPETSVFLPKAIRTLCALICHHVDRKDRFSKELARDLLDRCSGMLRWLPQDLLDRTLVEMGGKRAKRLRALRAGE